jgi:hypothetical protein
VPCDNYLGNSPLVTTILAESIRAVRRVVPWWRARSDRQIWLATLALVIVTCAEAIAIPAKRPALLSAVIVLVSLGWMSTESRRSRREREALAARLATLSRDDVPANVIDLLLAGKKIQAIRFYRELAGTSQREAKTRIDSL